MANWQRGVLRVLGVANHPVQVVAVHDYTSWYRRITFRAPEFLQGLAVFPTLWLRLWVPHPVKGQNRLSQRCYTLVDANPDEGTFALDFVLHDTEGPAGDWARTASVGDALEAAVTPARIALPERTTRLVLAGDITALPAINSWLAAVPEHVATAVAIEDHHPDLDLLPRTPRENVSWSWVPRTGPRGAALAAYLHDGGAGPSDASDPSGLYAWAAGERTLVKGVRRVLRDHLGLDRARHFTQFYWIEGRSFG